MDFVLGIDLGTTHSLAGIFQDGKPRLFQNAFGSYLTPSVVSLDDEGKIYVGLPARNRLSTHPHATASVFKRNMGSQKIFKLGKKEFKPEELSALILKSLKTDAETALGVDIHRAVITVPAYFRDAQRNATRIAGELAGFHVERIINEPTAAALAYGLHNKGADSKIVIFDLGGGTFDVSVLEIYEGVVEVRASAGDNFLGGEEFREVMEKLIREKLSEAGVLLPAIKAEEAGILREKAEFTKNLLSEEISASISIPIADNLVEIRVTRDDFASATKDLILRLNQPVIKALRDARIRTDEIDEVILVGGATRMPQVRESAGRMFGKIPNIRLQPDETVALGACVMAGLKSKDQDLKELVLTDVAPFSLGVEVSEGEGRDAEAGVFFPIIERNTVIPVSREYRFNTVRAGQNYVDLKIYQGEGRKVRDNVYLGRLDVKLPKNASRQEFQVRFSYDLNGVLEVETTDANGKKINLVLSDSPGSITKEDIAKSLKKLSALKIHPRDELKNIELVTRGEKLFAESLGADRLIISEQLHIFSAALDRQDSVEIKRAASDFEKFILSFESGNQSI